MTIAEYHGYVRLEKVYYIRSLMNAHADHCAHVAEFTATLLRKAMTAGGPEMNSRLLMSVFAESARLAP